MPLVEQLPESVAALAGAPADGELVIAIRSDLNLQGAYGEEWLLVTQERLLVCAGGVVRVQCPLERVRMPACESLIGGGALVATLDGRPVELIRYTNGRARRFGRAAKYLSDVAAWHEAAGKPEQAKEKPQLAEDTEEERRCPTCGLPFNEGSRVCPVCMDKSKVLLRVMGLLRPYWKRGALVMGLVVLGTAVSMFPPYLVKPLVDKVINPKEPVPLESRYALLPVLVLAMLGARVLTTTLTVLRGRMMARLGGQLGFDLRARVCSHVQFQSLKFFSKHNTGAIMARITQDTGSLESALIDVLPYFVNNVLTFIAIGVVLFGMNWRLTLLVLIPMPVVMVLSRLFWRRLMAILHRFFHFRARINAFLNDSLSGIRVVKAFAQESQEIARFHPHNAGLFDSTVALEQRWVTIFPMLWFITGLGELIVWYIGGRSVLGGDMTMGMLMSFIAYLGMFYGPLQFFTRIIDYLTRSLTAAERVFEVLDSDPDVREAENAVPMPRIEGRVEFRNVTFGYDQHKPVLHNVTLDVRPGEMIGFVGQSGAGKSTTISLICRFYDPQEGAICIDGADVRTIKQQDYRSQLGIVLQDTFLFNGSIADNIRYAKPEATFEEIMAAAKIANAHDFIVQKPMGYDTRVGERGQALSGGERQRIAIARAVLHNPRVLILDEATSSVDTDTEKQIQEAIARLVKGRTTFAIAHRLSTLRNADRLVVLKDGKIEEMGTHDELLEKKGEFHRLVQLQQEMSRIKAVSR